MLDRQESKEDTMALRVPKAELPAELRESMIKRFGAVPENVQVLWHSPGVARDSLEFGGKVGAWDTADVSLKSFAHMAVAAQVGCSWCLDIGYFHAQNQHLDLAKASQVPRWRESDVFTPLERDVLEYAEAMTNTPPTVTDELSASLLEVMAPDVVLIADGGGFATAALVPLHGAELVATLLARADRVVAAFKTTVVWLNGAPAGRIEVGGQLAAVSLEVENGRITRIYAVANPRKLTRLDEPAELTR
jgi:alkylhydroperoxidase family enzyme